MNLTLREKICQSVMIIADPEKHKKEYGSIENFLKEYPIGGIFVGGQIIKEAKNDAEFIKNIIEEYQKYSKIPLLVAADGERGIGSAVKGFSELPPQMCVGAANDEQLAYDFGAVCGRDGMSVGINITFAPVSDLNINKQNLITNVRSITDDVELGTRLLPKIISGIQDAGMLATAKHFPGDGIDYRDQHITGSCNSLSAEEWMQKSGAMFKKAIESDVAAIMTGHISAPAFQTSIKGNFEPATLSSELVTDLLKGKLGYKGLVITDALDMGGFIRWYYEPDEAEIKAYEIGNDMLLWPHISVIDKIVSRVEDGKIPMDRVEDALERVMNAKKRIGKCDFTDMAQNADFGAKTAKKLSEKGTCIIKNDFHLIPLKKDIKKIRIVAVTTEDSFAERLKLLQSEFIKRGVEAEFFRSWCVDKNHFFENLDRNYDLILFAIAADSRNPNFMGQAAVTLRTALMFDRDKTIIASFGSPYYYSEFCRTAETYINSYLNDFAMERFVAGLFGECELCGKPSVKLK